MNEWGCTENYWLAEDISQAFDRCQFHLEYQPQVAVADGALIGFEALLRWDHPRFGGIPPGWFVPIAEQTGLIVPIGAWVIAAACMQLATWEANGLPPLTMSVNISPCQLQQPDFVEIVMSALKRAHLSPERLELEVTEEKTMHPHQTAVVTALAELRSRGVHIALDDFGVGYSCLARLHQLPVDRIKIDRRFVAELVGPHHDRAAAISQGIVTLVRVLGLGLVAEGVETQLQLDILGRQGCEVVQGYLIGQPTPPNKVFERFGLPPEPTERASVIGAWIR